jgi:acetyl-CoA acetyltransferase
MTLPDVAVLGTGMTDMSRRDLAPETMAYQVVHEALDDAGLSSHDLGLVIVGNAMAHRLSDQGCVRGQTWLRKAGLSEAAIVNVDNSCAGGSSALHLATMAAVASDRPVLALGVEKMWTGDRAQTMAGIEDGLPAEYRYDLHERRQADNNPAGSILMGLNNVWAQRRMKDVGLTVRQIASAAVKAFRHASRNPLAQCQRTATIDEVLESPQVAGVLTRLMCSSSEGPPSRHPRRRPVSSARWHAPGMAYSTTTTVWPTPPRRPGRPSASGPTTPTWSNCTTPRRQRRSMPSSRSASSATAKPDRRQRPG